MNRITRLVCIFLIAISATCVVADDTQPEAIKPVVLDSTQIFTIYSTINNQNYRIQARLPGSYQTNLSKKYPVIIKVDGQWDYPLAASIFNNIYFDGQMPETIVIGIDWADVKGNIHAIRARDLLPAPIQQFENSGHAKRFISVLVNEIIPALSQRFRLNGQKFLLGSSWGGTFATYALLEQPDAFDGAIAIGGDYRIAGDVFNLQLKSIAQSKSLVKALDGKRLYIGVGKGDLVAPGVLAYAESLKAAKLTGLRLKVDALEGYGHSGMNVPGYAGGYKYLFERPQILVAPEKLEKYVGKYISADKSEGDLVIQMESGKLVALKDGDKLSLLAKAENDFYYSGSFFNVTFEESQVTLETFSGTLIYKRVEAVSHQ